MAQQAAFKEYPKSSQQKRAELMLKPATAGERRILPNNAHD